MKHFRYPERGLQRSSLNEAVPRPALFSALPKTSPVPALYTSTLKAQVEFVMVKQHCSGLGFVVHGRVGADNVVNMSFIHTLTACPALSYRVAASWLMPVHQNRTSGNFQLLSKEEACGSVSRYGACSRNENRSSRICRFPDCIRAYSAIYRVFYYSFCRDLDGSL